MKKSKIILVFTLLLFNLVCLADTGFNDDVEDVTTPLNQDLIYVLIFAVTCFAFYKIRNHQKTE